VISLGARRLPLARMARCLSVSVFTTLLSMLVLVVAVTGGVRPWLANVIATAVGTVPSYVLNRRWVWGLREGSDPWREVAPFWALSFGGLALSTLAVDRADHLAATLHVTGAARTLGLLAANVASFGVLWVAQFLLLDRVLFGRVRVAPATVPSRPPRSNP
jgi:putative flippase GtrA